MNSREQELLARVLDLFATEFSEKAILCGGMVLNVMGSARYTKERLKSPEYSKLVKKSE